MKLSFNNQDQNQYSFIVPQMGKFVCHIRYDATYKKPNNNSIKINNITKKVGNRIDLYLHINMILPKLKADFFLHKQAVLGGKPCLRPERWRGPPHINKVKQRDSLFIQLIQS